MKERPIVKETNGGKYYEYAAETFNMKVYVPHSDIDGKINNYTFKAPMLTVFEENKQGIEEAVSFANNSGLSSIASANDSVIVFIYPNNEGGWKNATEELYKEYISLIKMDPVYEDGIVDFFDFINQEFKGYFIRGALFRACIYSFGESADYVATKLLRKVDGQYLWGPGDITPAVCSMERLSVMPVIERDDIPVISINNSDDINNAFENVQYKLIKNAADYKADFKAFASKFKRWVGNLEIEPDLDAMNLVEEPGYVVVNTSPENTSDRNKGTKTHKMGYFAYYNKGIFDNGPVPLLLGFHGGGDSSFFFTYVSGWHEIVNKYNFLFVAIENHTYEMAEDIIQILPHLKEKYNIDEKRIYACGFSMGSGKTWDMLAQFPETFAGFIPSSALFPMDNPYSPKLGDKMNRTIPVPMFYSGGEMSPLPELPCQASTCLDRIKYGAEVNKLKKKSEFDKLSYDERDKWESPIWGVSGDRVEVFHDDVRDANLTVHYFDSEDGVCRTAYASIDNQMHECRQHTCEVGWNFVSKFSK